MVSITTTAIIIIMVPTITTAITIINVLQNVANVARLPFLDTHVSLAPTQVSLLVSDTFEFPFLQCLWSLYVKS